MNQLKHDGMYVFKVGEYLTELVGRYDQHLDQLYVQRGDGTRYDYLMSRVDWYSELSIVSSKVDHNRCVHDFRMILHSRNKELCYDCGVELDMSNSFYPRHQR